MSWFNEYHGTLINVFDLFFIRVRQLLLWFGGVLGIVSLHINLLHLPEVWNDRVSLIILVIMALNHSVVEKQ